MNRFWNRYIQPVIDVAEPHLILEVGADRGWNTRNILKYCRDHGTRADIVDPAPQPSLHEVLREYEDEHDYYPLKSLVAIPQLDTPDVALMDGDHNWATIHAELTLLFARAEETGAAPPLIITHDVAWPYARRDMYYNPDDLDPSERHPYAYSGMLPGHSELTELGMNGVLANALHEGGPRNGVLTGIEDFLDAYPGVVHRYTLPFFNGLGIFVPAERMSEELEALLAGFFSADSLLQACVDLERDSMHVRAMLQVTEARLARRTEALVRARQLLDERATQIDALKRTTAPA